MIDTLWNQLFRCSHRHLTRPITAVTKAGVPQGDTYVVCLDCAKQFTYDLKEMRIGKPIGRSHESSVLAPGTRPRRGPKLKHALWLSVPLAVFAGLVLKSKKPVEQSNSEPAGKAKTDTR